MIGGVERVLRHYAAIFVRSTMTNNYCSIRAYTTVVSKRFCAYIVGTVLSAIFSLGVPEFALTWCV